jgi:TRAP-type C4-dicarboxylate transport system substrate-binding protein
MSAGEWVGRAWEVDFEGKGLKVLEAGGVEHVELSPEEAAKFEAAAETVVQRWIDDAGAKGLDGQALVDQARAAVKAAAQ